MSSWGLVVTGKNTDIVSFKDLENKRLGIIKSSVYLGEPAGVDKYIEAFGLNTDLVEVSEYPEIYKLIEEGKIDAGVVSRISALTNRKDHPNIKQTDLFFNPTELRFALTKNAPDNKYLIEKLDFWVKKLRDDPKSVYYQSLNNHGLGETVVSREVVPLWVKLTGFGVLGALTFTSSIIVWLRHTKASILKKLRQKEALLVNTIRYAPILVFAFNKQKNVTFAEGKALSDMGLETKDLVGSSITKWQWEDPSTPTRLSKALDGKEVEVKEILHNKTWLIHVSPVPVDTEIDAAIGIAIDLTETEKLEKAKMEFLNLVSHHLRTLPSEIKWILELLAPKAKSVMSPDDIKHWENLENANNRMINLANSISKASQIELGKVKTSLEQFNLPELINQEIEEFRSTIQEKDLELATDFHDVGDIVSDKTQLRIVINALLSNAVNYIFPKGKVEVKLSAKDKNFVLSVKDTGWGIPTEQQDKIFTRLFRADNVVKMNVLGIGLSLAVAKSIIEKFGGRIWFESKENHGSTFYVELPQRII